MVQKVQQTPQTHSFLARNVIGKATQFKISQQSSSKSKRVLRYIHTLSGVISAKWVEVKVKRDINDRNIYTKLCKVRNRESISRQKRQRKALGKSSSKITQPRSKPSRVPSQSQSNNKINFGMHCTKANPLKLSEETPETYFQNFVNGSPVHAVNTNAKVKRKSLVNPLRISEETPEVFFLKDDINYG